MTGAAPSLRRVAALLAASAGLSRVLGYGRDLLLNAAFGASSETDVFRASFAVPDMLNYLLAGGALTVSFLPQMAALYARLDAEAGERVQRHDEIDALFSKIASLLLTIAVLLVIGVEVFAEPLVALWVDGFTPAQTEATARLTRIVAPAQIFFLFGGLLQATLMARGRFGALALTPLLYNGGMLVGGLLGAWAGRIDGFSWGALVGAGLGAFAVPMVAARGSLRFRPRLPTIDADVRAFLWIGLPLMFGVSLTSVDEWLGLRYGSRLGVGEISWLTSARRLVLVPIGLVGTAAGQATGAFVARLYAESQRDPSKRHELSRVLGQAVAGVLGLSLILTAFACAAAEPIVGALFEHGRFGRDDTVHTAGALVPMALGIAAWAMQSVVARALYGIGDTWRPMLLTSVITALSLPLYSGLTDAFGLPGLAFAGVIGMSAQVATFLLLARKALGLELAPLGDAALRALPVAGLAAAATAGADLLALSLLPAGLPAVLGYALRLGICAVGWAAVVLPLGQRVGLPGLDGLVRRLRARLPGAKRP